MFKSFIFILNSLAACLLLTLLVLSYVPPSSVPMVPSITLLTPVLLAVNGLFVLYWILSFSKKCLLSIITLLICTPFVLSFFQFNLKEKKEEAPSGTIKILDFNSHNFCGIEDSSSFEKYFLEFIDEEDPDILFFQEIYLRSFEGDFLETYKYNSTTTTKGIRQGANPIFSKFPIVNYGSVGMDDPSIGRNTLFADIKIGINIVRCYNMHLTSYGLAKEAEELKEKGAKTIISRLNAVFKYQEQQTNKIIEHVKNSPYPIIFCGDFNNMAFSYVYREIKSAGNLKDTFNEKGTGFGATHDFSYFPTRIDFTLVSDEIDVISHKVIKTRGWSDHYPVISTINL